MQRITISFDDALANTFDEYLGARGYQSRSEGVRDLVRGAVEHWKGERRESPNSVAVLSYIYDRNTRELAERLSKMHHAHHDLVLAVTQTPLDHAHSLVSVILNGATDKVRELADRVRAERGVTFGSLNLTGVDLVEHHVHSGDHSHPGHAHLSPTRLQVAGAISGQSARRK